MQQILDYLDKELENSLDRLCSLLQLKSISTDPAYNKDCYETAQFLKTMLSEIGFEANLHDFGGHPLVLASHEGPSANSAHLLFYGHYDVQPVDPLDLWEQPPFEPKIVERGGERQILARGASDDKGQLMTFIEACRAYKKVKKSLPCKVTILLEGEEESGSSSLVPFLKAYKEELKKADFALVCDTTMWSATQPAITVALRGILAQEVEIIGAKRDLHSGAYGGAAANPITILSRILGKLHDDKGHITLKGFYDNVKEVPAQILASWNDLGLDAERFLAPIGLKYIAGEKGYSLLETIWARPTAEINGIQGGYCGEGFKTVIPSTARAKISFRLVEGQDPEKIKQSFQNFVKENLPKDCQCRFIDHGGSKATQLSYDHPLLAKAKLALSEEWPEEALLIASGGSIPVVEDFKNNLGLDCLLVGFALDDDNIHSPNEKYNVTSFHKGQKSWVRILESLTKKQDKG